MNDFAEMGKDERKAYLKILREGLLGEVDAVQQLSRLACEYNEQALQKAALTGLVKHLDSDAGAILALARRLLDSWGMGSIGHTIKICGRVHEKGGLILLAATLFMDDRFIYEKLEQTTKVLEKKKDELALRQLEELPDAMELMREPALVKKWRGLLQRVANLDIREGVIFGSQFRGTVGWIGSFPGDFSPQEVFRARRYVDSRIPGLEDVFSGALERLS